MKSWIYAFIIMIIIITVVVLDMIVHDWVSNSNLPLWIKMMLLK